MMEVKGVPPRELLEKAPRRKNFFDDELNPFIITNSRGKKRVPGTKDLQTVLRCNDPVFLDFI